MTIHDPHFNPGVVTQGGIWASSSASASESYLVFCVGNDILRESTFKAWAAEQCIGIKPLFGSYKGQSERSFIANRRFANELAPWIEGQESVLYLSPLFRFGRLWGRRRAALLYLADGRHEDLGHLTTTTYEEAMRRDCWTFDPTDGSYWVTEPLGEAAKREITKAKAAWERRAEA